MAKDVDLFKAAMAGVKPLAGRKKRKSAAPSLRRDEKRPVLAASPVVRAKPAAEAGTVAELAFDRDVDRALSRGTRSPEAKLDLHGMTLAAAERAVAR